jgi:hypothetical protein
MNEAAKRIVARAARAGAGDRNTMNAMTDSEIVVAWEQAVVENPEIETWSGAKEYFESVYMAQIDRVDGGSR